MPFYAFHLDVPAPPEVVSERVRVAVGKVPTFWESMKSSWKGPRSSAFPFLGTVSDRSFNIRRNIQYRNSFLPMIRGKIVATPTGSRVNVLMFMHPVSLIFTLLWLGFVGSVQWRLLDANVAQSYAPMAMLLFALVVSLGGFFFEALKVMPLLSEAVFNPTITAAPKAAAESQLRDPTLDGARSSTGSTVAAAAAVLLLVCGLAATTLYERYLKSSPAFTSAIDLVARSPAVKAALGTPVKAGTTVRGIVQLGYAALAIPVSGPAGKGTLYVVANRLAGGWDIERAVLDATGGNSPAKIDLTPPTQAEAFRYAATGRVYLLPLDAAAASDLKELPAYYQARLGLDVTVLPVQELEADVVDAKAKQVISEKALDSIELAHREIADDLDSVILGVTSQDINLKTAGWKFATNYRRGRFGIMSTARLHDMPWYAGANPEVFAVRVRKMATKNLALLHYPVELSSDFTSALASATFTAADVDSMGESFGGEFGTARSINSAEPCVTITQGRKGKQSWRLGCDDGAPPNSRFETFQTYTTPNIPPLVMSRADFYFDGQPSFPFVRKYRPQDDMTRAFGMGATDSFDIFPVGDSQTFATIQLVLADGGVVEYHRTSPGQSYADAKLRAYAYMGSPFSLSSLAWNGNGWDLDTMDGWTYRFPSSGPGRTWQQGALTGIRSASGQAFSIQRDNSSDLQEIRSPGGASIEFTCDAMHRIISAKETSGHAVRYEYDSAGRLAHVQDSEDGDEFYEYDASNRLTSVLDTQHHPLLVNEYGYVGEMLSQTLADGRKLTYVIRYDGNHHLNYAKLTLPNGYTIEWMLTSNGLIRSMPQAPSAVGATPHS